MLTKYVEAGEKVELQLMVHDMDENPEIEKKVYYSVVYDILSDDRLEIFMPMEKQKLILLPVDSEYDMFIYTKTGLLQCFARIVDRYKSNNVYILSLELISNLRKYQRREFYRFACALEMDSRPLNEEEVKAYENGEIYLDAAAPLTKGIIVDISGGGIRFTTTAKYEVGAYLYCTYSLLINNLLKDYKIVGKVLRNRSIDNRPGEYECRVQFLNLNPLQREEIIKFIFDEERKNRKNLQR